MADNKTGGITIKLPTGQATGIIVAISLAIAGFLWNKIEQGGNKDENIALGNGTFMYLDLRIDNLEKQIVLLHNTIIAMNSKQKKKTSVTIPELSKSEVVVSDIKLIEPILEETGDSEEIEFEAVAKTAPIHKIEKKLHKKDSNKIYQSIVNQVQQTGEVKLEVVEETK